MSEPSIPWQGYREIPSRLNIADEVLERPVAAGHGDRTAMVWDGGSLSYRELRGKVHGFARGLKELGVSPGDPVLVQMPNSPEFAVAFLAAVKLGALPVVVNSLLGVGELQAILEQTKPGCAVTEGSRAQALRQLRESSGSGPWYARGRLRAARYPSTPSSMNRRPT